MTAVHDAMVQPPQREVVSLLWHPEPEGAALRSSTSWLPSEKRITVLSDRAGCGVERSGAVGVLNMPTPLPHASQHTQVGFLPVPSTGLRRCTSHATYQPCIALMHR